MIYRVKGIFQNSTFGHQHQMRRLKSDVVNNCFNCSAKVWSYFCDERTHISVISHQSLSHYKV